MFDRVARRYDLANHLLSGGCDFWWRSRAAGIVEQWQPRRVLDLATGSGDLALAIGRRLPDAEVTGADFSAAMLARARAKGVAKTIVADALELPFADEAFDVVTVAFGLRNMADWGGAIEEMARVLKPQGQLLILDFSLPQGILAPAYLFYLRKCLPRLARLITGERKAYEYLGDSIEEFPSGKEMIALVEEYGFRGAKHLPLTGGITSIYCAQRSS